MIVERHLILQELNLASSAEWVPSCQGWLMVRVAEGTGYWLPHGAAHRQLNPGDGLMVVRNADGVVRASWLSPLKLQFFTVQLQYLNGILTVAEWQQLEVAPNHPDSPASVFTAGEPIGQKFMRLADQTHSHRLSTALCPVAVVGQRGGRPFAAPRGRSPPAAINSATISANWSDR